MNGDTTSKAGYISFIAPVLIIISNATLYLTGDSLFYSIVYTVSTSLLGYHTMRCILASYAGGTMLRGEYE
ncbi:MAG TPA: hypothetical protein PLZ84_08705 [Clostridia bacterium]|nr:hypothetical protein [Clostridia bacterium]